MTGRPPTPGLRIRELIEQAKVADQSGLDIFAVGGTPTSVVRAAHLGLPMALAIIGGSYRQFAPFADLYRKAAAQFGHDVGTLKLSINSPGFLAATHREAIEVSHPYFESGWMAIQMGFGNVPRREMLKSIELLGTEVAPVVRKEIASRQESVVAAREPTR